MNSVHSTLPLAARAQSKLSAKARPKAAFFGHPGSLDRVFAKGRREKIRSITQVETDNVAPERFLNHLPSLGNVEVIFSTWGVPSFTHEMLEQMPCLRALFYAAGSVQSFARPLLERGITVVSAWQMNAIPVAEFTLAQILLSTKGYFCNTREYNHPAAHKTAFIGTGNFGETVALLGAGAIGRRVIELLRPFHLKIIVFDPFLSDDDAAELGVEKVSLQAAFERAFVVSNHLANLPETVGMLHGGLFESMRPHATFINTGRGATVDEPAMISVLQKRPDLTALLDVTFPDIPAENSPLFSAPNIQLSTHIAGSNGDEFVRLADCCIEEFLAWRSGAPLRYSVSLAMLEKMA